MSTDQDNKTVLRVVIPHAYLKPDIPLIPPEDLEQEKISQLHYGRALRSYLHELYYNHLPEDKRPNSDLFETENIQKMYKQLYKRYALVDERIRIGITVKLHVAGENEPKVLYQPRQLKYWIKYLKTKDQNDIVLPKYLDISLYKLLNTFVKGEKQKKAFPPITKYGLTYFPFSFRFEFKDLDLKNIGYDDLRIEYEFWAIFDSTKDEGNKTRPEIWMIAHGTMSSHPEEIIVPDPDEDKEEEPDKKNKPAFVRINDWIDVALDKLRNDPDIKFEDQDWTIKLTSVTHDEDKSRTEREFLEATPKNKFLDLSLTYLNEIKEMKSKKSKLHLSDKGKEPEGQPKDQQTTDSPSCSWAKITTLILTSESAETIKWDSEKNEYPVMPSHGIEDVTIIDANHTVDQLLKQYKDKTIRYEVETFILKQCSPTQFHDTLMKCIIESDDPIKTAMNASQICEERKKHKNSTGIDWEEEKEKAIATAIRIAEFIPNQLKKLHMTNYYSEAAKVILDENLDHAIEGQFDAICADAVFVERLDNRWSGHGNRKGLRVLEYFSPKIWFSLQAICFFLYVVLMCYSTTTSNGVFVLSYRNSLNSNYFNDQFNSIGDPESFWDWVDTTLIPGALPENDTVRYNSHQWLATPDITLRLYRVLPLPDNECTLSSFDLKCYPSIDRAATSNLLVGFGDLTHLRSENWTGTNWLDDEHESTDIQGLSFIYKNGGYMALLQGDQQTALSTSAALRANNWIDSSTRAVMVEFALYELDGNMFAMFHVLVEFTHVGVVNIKSGLTIVDHHVLSIQKGDWAILVLIIWTVGLIVQEFTELLVLCLTKIDELNQLAEEKSENAFFKQINFRNYFRPFYHLIPNPIRFLTIASGKTLKEHFELWNIMDFSTYAAMAIYCIMYLITRVEFSPFRVSNVSEVSLNHLYYLEYLIEITRIFGSIGVILGSVRLLYFFIPVRALGPLVLSMLRMYIDVLYFIMLLIVMIVGFAGAFNLIYGGIAQELTGFGMSVFTCLTVAYNQQFFVQNDEFVPLAIYWFGDIIMVAYFVLSAILLINLLIAMMSTTYNNLMGDTRRTQGEWRVEFGDHLLHYERFLIVPPPLNLIQFILFLFALAFQYKSKRYQSFLFGDWNSRDRAIGRLYRDKYPEDQGQEFKKKELKKIGNLIRQKEESIWKTIKHLIKLYGNEAELATKPKDKLKLSQRTQRTHRGSGVINPILSKPPSIRRPEKVVEQEKIQEQTVYSGGEEETEDDQEVELEEKKYSSDE